MSKRSGLLAHVLGLIVAAPLLWPGTATAEANVVPTVDGEVIGTAELLRAACKEGQVVFYSAQADANEKAIVRAFEQQFPCVKVSVISAVTGRLSERILTEARAGTIRNDITMITDEAVAQRLIDGKLVRPWTPPAADKYGSTSKVQGWWYAGSGSVMYPIRNSRLLSEADAPKSWVDLLDPKWKGKIGTAPITVGGISWMVYAFLTEKFGRDYLLKFLAQDPRMFAGYGHVMLSVERGELLLGTVGALDEYSRRTVERAPIAPIFPTEGVPFANYPMMLMANSPNPNAGELLSNWYLSKAGQSNLVRVRGAYPARPDVPGAPLNPPLADLKPWNPGHDFILREHSRLITEVTKIFGGR